MIEELIQELIEALKANTEALKASSQPAPLPPPPKPPVPGEPIPPNSITTSQGSTVVMHDGTIIAHGQAEQRAAQDAVETVAVDIELPKRRGRPPKSIVSTIPKVTPEPTAEATEATGLTPEVVPQVIPKPVITLEQVRAMGQKLLDLTGDTTPIRTYVNERGCKALRELPPEQWAEAYEWLSGMVKKSETP